MPCTSLPFRCVIFVDSTLTRIGHRAQTPPRQRYLGLGPPGPHQEKATMGLTSGTQASPSRHSFGRQVSVIGVAATAALTLAACGSSSGSSAASTSSTTAPTSAAGAAATTGTAAAPTAAAAPA